MEKNDILVSVCCITYNQENYIRDALDGFLKQKVNFNYEIIVHDDASTDNTPKILKEYEEKYPNKIKVLYEEENQFRKGKKVGVLTYSNAKGKYVAICEGDDYWIDENKLQLQVDYMEKNPECSLIFHNAKIIDMYNNKEEIFVPYTKYAKQHLKKDGNYNVGELELLGFIPTASFMFKKENLEKIPDWFEKCYVGDWPLKLIMTSFGYAHYIDKVMSVYRRNANGSMTVSNVKRENEDIEGKLEILRKKEFFINHIDDFTKHKYHDIFEMRLLQYETERMLYTGREKEIIKKGYTKYILPGQKIKYILRIYLPGIFTILKKIKNKLKQ